MQRVEVTTPSQLHAPAPACPPLPKTQSLLLMSTTPSSSRALQLAQWALCLTFALRVVEAAKKNCAEKVGSPRALWWTPVGREAVKLKWWPGWLRWCFQWRNRPKWPQLVYLHKQEPESGTRSLKATRLTFWWHQRGSGEPFSTSGEGEIRPRPGCAVRVRNYWPKVEILLRGRRRTAKKTEIPSRHAKGFKYLSAVMVNHSLWPG